MPCCILDLQRIETQDDLDWVNELLGDLGGAAWPSLEAALTDLEQTDGLYWTEDEREVARELRAKYLT